MGSRSSRVIDPRPDITQDSAKWQKLLQAAWDLGEPDMEGVYGVLLGMRCMGAHLIPVNGGWRLVRGEMDEAEYSQCREKYLMPHAAEIQQLLQALQPVAEVANG